MAQMLPFFVNVRIERVGELLDMMNDADTPVENIEWMKEEVVNILKSCKTDLKTAMTVVKTWDDNTIDTAMCNNLCVYLSAALLKMRKADYVGLKWCIDEIHREVGYTPTPMLHISGRAMKTSSKYHKTVTISV